MAKVRPLVRETTVDLPESGTWERQPGEGPQAFFAFCVYRDLGPGRSLPEAYRMHTGKQTPRAGGTWTMWYRRHDWKVRAEAYDAELDRVRRAKRLAGVDAMIDRHAKNARFILDAMDFAIVALTEEISKVCQENGNLDIAKLARLAQTFRVCALVMFEAMKAERLALGEPTTIQKQVSEGGKGTGDRVLEWVDELVDKLVAEGRL